jgi:hypothetical protein
VDHPGRIFPQAKLNHGKHGEHGEKQKRDHEGSQRTTKGTTGIMNRDSAGEGCSWRIGGEFF